MLLSASTCTTMTAVTGIVPSRSMALVLSLMVAWPTPPGFHQVASSLVACCSPNRYSESPAVAQYATMALPGAETSSSLAPGSRLRRPSLMFPPPWMNPLAGVPPNSLALAAVPFTPRKPLAGVPPSSLAFSLGTCTLLLTVNGGVVGVEDRLSAVPLVFVSEDTDEAVLALPRIKSPPVAATAVPDMANNSAIREMTLAGAGRCMADLPRGPAGDPL